MQPDESDVERIVAGLTGAHRRLAQCLSSRWIKGTGICHRSVGRDLVDMGLAEGRSWRGVDQIRAMPALLAVRARIIGGGQ